jgi:hypothetical protein
VHGHTVLQFLPYYSKLNPTELIWATVKNWVAEKNVMFKLDDVVKLNDESFAAFTNEDWKERCACSK